MKTGQAYARSILSRTNIPGIDYCLNPYVGCSHACRYCYATYMRKYSGHDEPWGTFVDVKVNAVELLKKALRRDHHGEVILSSVTDPYQPAEASWRITRGCLELLSKSRLKVCILTKSDLVTRDTDILKGMEAVEAGLTITTDNERTKCIFESNSSSISARVKALEVLASQSIPTYVFVGPILPMNPARLADLIGPLAGRVLVDRMNYAWKVRDLYEANGLAQCLDASYFAEVESGLLEGLRKHGIDPTIL
jgi:DNA repair photolyase